MSQNRKCGDCTESMLGSFGVWCQMFQLYLWDEAEAEECAEYAPNVRLTRKEPSNGAEA